MDVGFDFGQFRTDCLTLSRRLYSITQPAWLSSALLSVSDGREGEPSRVVAGLRRRMKSGDDCSSLRDVQRVRISGTLSSRRTQDNTTRRYAEDVEWLCGLLDPITLEVFGHNVRSSDSLASAVSTGLDPHRLTGLVLADVKINLVVPLLRTASRTLQSLSLLSMEDAPIASLQSPIEAPSFPCLTELSLSDLQRPHRTMDTWDMDPPAVEDCLLHFLLSKMSSLQRLDLEQYNWDQEGLIVTAITWPIKHLFVNGFDDQFQSVPGPHTEDDHVFDMRARMPHLSLLEVEILPPIGVAFLPTHVERLKVGEMSADVVRKLEKWVTATAKRSSLVSIELCHEVEESLFPADPVEVTDEWKESVRRLDAVCLVNRIDLRLSPDLKARFSSW